MNFFTTFSSPIKEIVLIIEIFLFYSNKFYHDNEMEIQIALTAVCFSGAAFARVQMLGHFVADESICFTFKTHPLDLPGDILVAQSLQFLLHLKILERNNYRFVANSTLRKCLKLTILSLTPCSLRGNARFNGSPVLLTIAVLS